jgi:hypothetical protein
MRKRITLLIAALMLALTMSFGTMAAFGATENLCESNPDHKQCVLVGPGNSENTSAAQGGNPNIREDRDNPSARN